MAERGRRAAGNDVVDLGEPANAGAHARLRFVGRVCGEEERRSVEASADPGALLWSFFAAKEAAFKLACKLGPRPVFAHRDFVVDPALAWVDHDGRRFSLRVEREGDLVHAVAWTGGLRPLALVGPVDPANRSADAGLEARGLLIASIAPRLGCAPEALAVVRDPEPASWDDLGPPRLLRDGAALDVDVSLSHDGRFVGFACLL